MEYSPYQGFSILFSDGDIINLIIWIGRTNYYDQEITIPQLDPNVFEFSGQIHNDSYGGINGGTFSGDGAPPKDEPVIMGTVRYSLKEETEKHFLFQYTITHENGSVLFDSEMKVLRYPWFESKQPNWLPGGQYYKNADFNLYGRSYYIATTPFEDVAMVTYVSGSIKIPYTALRQEEIDDTQKRVLYSVYGASPDSNLCYIEAHRNTRETVVFRFMDKEKGILEEGTGWISSRQEDLETW